jgi:hypothetical protein
MSTTFLHLLHPYALGHLRATLDDVRNFYEQLAKYPAVGENAQIAKNVIVDVVECSGIKLTVLDDVLAAVAEDLKGIDGELDVPLRREYAHGLVAVLLSQSLAQCRVVPALTADVRKLVDRVARSEALDKARLFINPAELISGFARMDVSGGSSTDSPRDIVTKGVLQANLPSLVCLRCGGRTQLPENLLVKSHSKGWATWERMWATRCICGGFWSSGLRWTPSLLSLYHRFM